MTSWKQMAALAASAIALSSGAWAQQTPAVASPAGSPEGVQAFDPAFFARFNPVTADDMVRQLPGFTLDEVAEHIVRHPATQGTQQLSFASERMVEHQRHRVVKA